MCMNISDNLRCIFIHIPKVAGTSIKQALALPGQGHPFWQYFARTYPEKWRSYRKFTVIRNPWDRAVSAYCYAMMKESYWHSADTWLHPDFQTLKDKSFDEFCQILLTQRNTLKHESWYPQYPWVTTQSDGEIFFVVNDILRYETLNRDFENLTEKLGVPDLKLPHVNKTNRSDYRKYYNKKTRDIISQIYRPDIELFQYSY